MDKIKIVPKYSVVGPCVTLLFSVEFHGPSRTSQDIPGHPRTSQDIPGKFWKVADVFPRISEINGLYNTFIRLPRNFANKWKFKDIYGFYMKITEISGLKFKNNNKIYEFI